MFSMLLDSDYGVFRLYKYKDIFCNVNPALTATVLKVTLHYSLRQKTTSSKNYEFQYAYAFRETI